MKITLTYPRTKNICGAEGKYFDEEVIRKGEYMKYRLTEYENILKKFVFSGKILEVGCGTGAFGKHIKSTEVIGIDISRECLKIAKNYEKVVLCDIRKGLPFPDRSFNRIFCAEVLHHVYLDIHKILEEFDRILKENGEIFIVEPNGAGFYFLMSKQNMFSIAVYSSPEEKPVSLEEFETSFKDAGFELNAWIDRAYYKSRTKIRGAFSDFLVFLFPNVILGRAIKGEKV